ncbi:MAG: thiamine pyrophosphate-binding protein [Planctomycetota bacterium]|nr:thiamine pyrophosphate-binding protein [Planctomycetota bacterium]
MNGNRAIIEQFLADGITYMFGNPGTVEQGFLDALTDYPRMKYILTLQESIAVMAADGYARAAKKPALVQIHSSPGLGNAIGALYQAKRGHSPLVVIGGDAGVKYQAMDAQMAADLVAMAEPVTKYATCVNDAASLLRVLRRAVKIAATPPMGPVYVCLPADVLDKPNEEPVRPAFVPSTCTVADAALIEEAAGLLLAAERPVIFYGDGVARSGAEEQLTRVAEILGAEAYGADVGELNMDTMHPLCMGTTGHMFGPQSLPMTRKGDVNLIVGTYMLPEVFPELGDVFAPGAKVIHFDLNAYEIAKNHRVDIGAVCDPKVSLQALADVMMRKITPARRERSSIVLKKLKAEKAAQLAAELKRDLAKPASGPLRMSQFAAELARQMPADAVVFDEALTSSPELTRHCPPQKPGHYFVTRGGSLGVGIPGAIGVRLAHPDRTVIGFTGDGGSMYTIQALWTAAHHGIGAKFVICNNRSYRLLKLNIQHYWKDQSVAERDFPASFELSEPPLDFSSLARAQGVHGVKVDSADQIAGAIRAMFSEPGPFLIDLVLSPEVPGHPAACKCGQ